MSDVELFWDALRAKWGGITPSWHELHPVAQNEVIVAINLILNVLNNVSVQNAK